MELPICFMCLKTFKKDEKKENSSFHVFCKFAKDYLKIREFNNFVQFGKNIEGSQNQEKSFCEECDVLVESVCELYLELLGIQLRISWKLGEMHKVLVNSKRLDSKELENVITSVGKQMGKGFRCKRVKQLRDSLEMKCMETGKENDLLASKSLVGAFEDKQLEYWVAIKIEDDDDADEPEMCLNEEKPELKLEDEADTDQEGVKMSEEFTPDFEDEETRFDVNNNEINCANSNVDKDSQPDCSWSKRTLRQRKREALKETEAEETDKPSLTLSPSFKKKAALKQKGKKSSYSKWNCFICNKPATNLRNHIKCHKNSPLRGNPLQCSFCWKSYSLASTFENHTLAAHMTVGNDGPFACDFEDCGASFFSIEDMNWHIKTHVENPFRCQTCGLAFSNEDVLKLHQLRHIRPLKLIFPRKNSKSKQASQLIYPCPDCDLDFPHFNKLHDHHARRHGSGLLKPYRCPHCASFSRYKQAHRCFAKFTCSKKELTCYELGCLKEFKNSYGLYAHRRDFHTPVSCSRCKKQFSGLSFRNAHDKGENELCIDKIFICSICGKGYDSLKNLNGHVSKVHCETLLNCEDCGKSYKNRQNLLNHIAACHNPEKHKCPHCDKIFTTFPYLKRHIAYVHPRHSETGGKKPRHECPYCQEKFARKLVLESHLLKCNPAKAGALMETCKICGRPVKGGQWKFTMEKHVVTHMSAEERAKYGTKFLGKLHLCETCGKGFRKKNVYVKHCLTHERKRERFLCEKCPKSFFSDGKLQKHVEKVHLTQGEAYTTVVVEENDEKVNKTVKKVYFEL